MKNLQSFFSLIVLFVLFSVTHVFSQDKIIFHDYKLLNDVSLIKTVEGLAGNRNGNIDFGERITLQLSLRAVKGDFISTSAFVSSSDPYVNVITSKVSYNDISEGSVLPGNEHLVIDISPDAPHLHKAIINLKIMDSRKRDENGEYLVFADNFTITIHRVGPIQYGGAIIDDDNIGQSQGNGNMIIEKSDGRIEIPLILRNTGRANVTDTVVKFSSLRDYVTIIEDTHRYASIKAGADGYTPSDYVFFLNDAAPQSVSFLPVKLQISGKYGGYDYNWIHDFRLGQFYGQLNVNVEPADAELIVNRKKEGTGQVRLTKVPVDEFIVITAKKDGYRTETFFVPVREDQTTRVDVIMMKDMVEELPLPNLNLVKWESYYKKPVLLPENKKVVNKGYLFTGIALTSLGVWGHNYAYNRENYEPPIGNIISTHIFITTPGVLLSIMAFTGKIKKDKPITKNINQNIIAIGEQQKAARERAEEVNKSRRELF